MRFALICCIFGLVIAARADDRGKCPGMPTTLPSAIPQHRKPPAGTRYAGAVMIFAEISDTGRVCEVRKLSGFDASADQQALRTVQAMRFSPARKNGQAVPVVVTTQVTFWRDANGKLVMEQVPKQEAQRNSPAPKDSAPALK